MFKIFFQLILLIYIIFVVYHLINLQKFNINGIIIECNTNELFNDNIVKLNPVCLNQETNFTIHEMKLHYLQDIINYQTNIPSYVFKNEELYERMKDNFVSFDEKDLHDSYHNVPIKKSLSIIKGENSIPLKKCIHNHNIIGVLEGEAVIYLFNPKHKDEIINKENHQIKKWGHKKKIQKGDVLIIPPYWSFIQEIEDGIIQYHIDIDNYFTCVPNFLKEFYFEYVDK